MARLVREETQNLVEDVSAAATVLCGHRPRIAKPQRVELRHVRIHIVRVELIGHEDDGNLGLLQLLRHDGVSLRDAHAGVDDEDDDVSGLHGGLSLARDGSMDALDVGVPSAGVLDKETAAVPLGDVGNTVAGNTRMVLDDGLAAPEETVDKRGLAHIRATHDGHGAKVLLDVTVSIDAIRGLDLGPFLIREVVLVVFAIVGLAEFRLVKVLGVEVFIEVIIVDPLVAVDDCDFLRVLVEVEVELRDIEVGRCPLLARGDGFFFHLALWVVELGLEFLRLAAGVGVLSHARTP